MKETIDLENWTPWKFITRNCAVCGSSVSQTREHDLIEDNPSNRVLLRICSDCIKESVVGIEIEYKCVECGYLEKETKYI